MSSFVEQLLFYLAVGKILIYLFQHFPPAEKLAQKLGQSEFYHCDLCLGVWAYFFWAALYQFSFVDTVSIGLNYFVTGAIASFIVHLLSLGWQTKFQTLVIE